MLTSGAWWRRVLALWKLLCCNRFFFLDYIKSIIWVLQWIVYKLEDFTNTHSICRTKPLPISLYNMRRECSSDNFWRLYAFIQADYKNERIVIGMFLVRFYIELCLPLSFSGKVCEQMFCSRARESIH